MYQLSTVSSSVPEEIRKPSSDQYKEIEENNRMEKTSDLFNKIRDSKETFMQDGQNKR